MKSSSQIVGLPVISITDGNEVGRVKSLIVNPGQKSIDFLTLQHDDWQISTKAIPFKKVIGVGEYAVTIDNAGDVIDLTQIPVTSELITKQIKIIGTKVMTRKGQLLGKVTEFFVDEDNGQITGVTVDVSDRDETLNAEHIITLGKDIMVVHEDAQRQLDSEFQPQPTEQKEDHSQAVEVEASSDTIREKQISILEGKEVIKDIYDANGDLLIAKETVLTKDEIVKAQVSGPSVVVDLSMNVR